MSTAARTLPRLAGILLVLGGAYAGLQLYPSEPPSPAVGRRADLIATVFYDQAMVFLLRVVILCAAAFTVLSIVARIWNRESRRGRSRSSGRLGSSNASVTSCGESSLRFAPSTHDFENRRDGSASARRGPTPVPPPLRTKEEAMSTTDEDRRRLAEAFERMDAAARRVDRVLEESDRRMEPIRPLLRRIRARLERAGYYV
ncbi:MAG TPA: hypothetical protein VK506_00890 [Conexibacter sp.]|nr:hypothetical protein [Conexibacter sp.]